MCNHSLDSFINHLLSHLRGPDFDIRYFYLLKQICLDVGEDEGDLLDAFEDVSEEGEDAVMEDVDKECHTMW